MTKFHMIQQAFSHENMKNGDQFFPKNIRVTQKATRTSQTSSKVPFSENYILSSEDLETAKRIWMSVMTVSCKKATHCEALEHSSVRRPQCLVGELGIPQGIHRPLPTNTPTHNYCHHSSQAYLPLSPEGQVCIGER